MRAVNEMGVCPMSQVSILYPYPTWRDKYMDGLAPAHGKIGGGVMQI